MVARVSTVAFEGIEAVPVDVQVMVAPGRVGMQIVGLPDKAVAESRERVQAALHASGLALPAKKVTVNLAPADRADLRFRVERALNSFLSRQRARLVRIRLIDQ